LRAVRRRLLAAALLTLALPADGYAAQTFGSDLSQPLASNGRCRSYPCSIVTQTRASGAPESGSPIDGVLVRVRFKYAGDGAAGVFRILRSASGTALQNAGEIAFTAPAAPAGDVHSFDVRHPVQRGDRIGLGADGSFATDTFLAIGAPRSCQFRQGDSGEHAAGAAEPYEATACELLVEGTVEPDADRDGLPDESADADDDGDHVPDDVERQRRTSPLDRDSDDDGLSDLREPRLGLNPVRADSDRDGLPDGLELGLTRGLPDPPGEVTGTDRKVFRRDRDPRTRTSPRRRDSDRDGRPDGREDRNHNGRVDRGETDPRKRDGDRRSRRVRT
jgi:hypothetical protein